MDPGLTKKIEATTHAFVANSRAGISFLSRTFSNTQHPLFLIPNFYDGYLSPRDATQQRNIKLGNPVILTHIANAYPEKDIVTAIHGARLLRQEGFPVKLRLIGEYPYRDIADEIVNLICRDGMESIVESFGALGQNETEQLLADTDIGLLSSRSEGSPNVVMEFMAHGIPVVGTRIPGIQDLVGPKNQEFLFPVGDPKGLCDSVRRLILDESSRSEVAAENLEYLTRRHCKEQVGQRWLELIDFLT
jgi:glycosyltransferase involved in cell wall biosynthesis